MPFVQSIKLINYRNHTDCSKIFDKRYVLITGDNGTGKTSILDAIYYLSGGKSYLSNQDRYLKQFDKDYFRLEGVFSDDKEQFNVKIISEKTKKISIDDKPIERIVDYFGKFPSEMIAPKDINIVLESSGSRRRLVDRSISQIDQNYLTALIKYNRLLNQRNALLSDDKVDMRVLDALDRQFEEPSAYISKSRAQYIEEWKPLLQKYFERISGGQELFTISYKAACGNQTIGDILAQNRTRDLKYKRTSAGLHRDDLILNLDQNELKKYGSQGQIKSSIIALKLTIMEWIFNKTQLQPILLLDDIFDKLDNTRVAQLLQLTKEMDIHQVFITDTDNSQLEAIGLAEGLDFQHIYLDNHKKL